MDARQSYPPEETHRGLWSRVRERVFGLEEGEDEAQEQRVIPPLRRPSLRMELSRRVPVGIRQSIRGMSDVLPAAQGLKQGEQQIVNLEQTDQRVAERSIDFLSGVAFALDGSVHKVGDRVYLFAPANVDVSVDTGSAEDLRSEECPAGLDRLAGGRRVGKSDDPPHQQLLFVQALKKVQGTQGKQGKQGGGGVPRVI